MLDLCVFREKSGCAADPTPSNESSRNVTISGRIEGGKVRKKRHTPEQIIAKLRGAEVALSQWGAVL